MVTRQHPVRSISHDERERLIQNAEDERTATRVRDRTLLMLLLNAGLRAQEVCRLRLADVNDGRCDCLTVYGKDGRERLVPLGLAAADALRHYLYECRLLSHSSAQALFLTDDGRPLDPVLLRQVVSTASEQAVVLEQPLTVHRLRGMAIVEQWQAWKKARRNGGDEREAGDE